MPARGKRAFGYCDKTGFRYPLNDLVYEYQNGIRTGLRVGRDVADKDHPQNRVGQVSTEDSQSLQDPRPDTATESLWGWSPVGNPGDVLTLRMGQVFVTN